MHAVNLMRVGKGADTKRSEERLIAVNPSRLSMDPEENADEVAHETAPPNVVPSLMAT